MVGMHAPDSLAQTEQTRELKYTAWVLSHQVPMGRRFHFMQALKWDGSGVQASSVVGRGAGGAHAAIKQQKAQLASLIARLRTQRQACQVACHPPLTELCLINAPMVHP